MTKVRRLLPLLPELDLTLGVIETVSKLNGVATTTRLRRAINDVSMELTMDSASLFSIDIIDPDYSILNNRALLRDRIDLDLGDRFAGFGRWRMHQPNGVGGFATAGVITTLRFWDLGAASLKARTASLVKPGSMAIEPLVALLAREASDPTGFDLMAVTPHPGEALPLTTATSGATGFTPNATKNVRIKGRAANTEQLKNINTALQVAVDEKASALAALALVCAGIGESTFLAIPNRGGSNYWGVFQGSKDVWAMDDTAGMARSFLRGGKGFQAGGAIKLARENPRITPGTIATRVEASGEPPVFYDQNHNEAKAIIEQWSGHTLDRWHTVTGAAKTDQAPAAKPAEWRRGTAKKAESSWAMLDRYGQQLGRRRFTCGNRLVMARDQDLIRAAPHQVVTPTDRTLADRLAIDYDGGARLQTIDLTYLKHDWRTPPGGVVQLEDAGPLDGPWLAQTVTASAKSPTVAVTLTQPVTEIPKPAKTSRTTAKTGGAAINTLLNGSQRGTVTFAPGIPKNVAFETLRFVELVAGIYGKPLVITTSTNHKRLTVNGLVSDHSTGHAVDIGMVLNHGSNDSPVGDAIAAAGLMAAGWSQGRAAAAAQRGGLWTITHSGLRIQVIWRYPDHHDHVHLGARPA